MSFEISAVANEPSSPAKQVTGSSHAAWVDISEGKITASNKRRDFVRIHAVILGFTAMDGLHIKGMTENESNALVFTEISDPVPAVHAFGADDQTVRKVRSDGAEVLVWLDMQKGFALLIQYADIQATGMQINFTVVTMSAIVKIH
ncbi:hypothetical protein HALA3H3_830067 [Halomonas sp. A3H3]|nr:hypothetical protein HALA3H3_830067 [Halomonas sp. A3H3]|tara:strand:- start:1400 stop:1837 length:438 start_codon:yes stop_codon:yes gene_type:complete